MMTGESGLPTTMYRPRPARRTLAQLVIAGVQWMMNQNIRLRQGSPGRTHRRSPSSERRLHHSFPRQISSNASQHGGCRSPWSAISPMLHGVLRLSVALLACVVQHERGARLLTVAAIANQLVFSFREERTYGGLPCPRLDGLRSVLPPPRTCDSKRDLSCSYWTTGRTMVGTLTSTARYKSVIGPMRRYAGTLRQSLTNISPHMCVRTFAFDTP